MKILSFVINLVCGLLFGIGMHVSGMSDPNKVIAFLDVTGSWDPSLAFVMAGALMVFAPFYHLVIKKRVINTNMAMNGEAFSFSSKTIIDLRLVTGAAIFGVGWGLSGFCPGPAVSSIATGSSTVLMFCAAMLVGMFIGKKAQ